MNKHTEDFLRSIAGFLADLRSGEYGPLTQVELQLIEELLRNISDETTTKRHNAARLLYDIPSSLGYLSYQLQRL